MSENLDLVRSICEMWERGEFRSTEWMHPRIEIMWTSPLRHGSTEGLAESKERFRDLLSTFEAATFETEEIRDIDHERVLVLGHYTGRGKMSRLDVRTLGREAALFHIDRGRVTKLVLYHDRDLAFAHLGLEA